MKSSRSREMPSLGPVPKKSPLPAIVLVATLVGLISGLSFWLGRKSKGSASPPTPPTVETPTPDLPAAAPAATKPTVSPPEVLEKATAEASGFAQATVQINGPLETAFIEAVGPEAGPPLTQVVTRLLVWWVDVPNGLLKGDTLKVLYEQRVGEEPLVHALQFKSAKQQKDFQAYRFQAPQAPFPRYYSADGNEIEERLIPSPIEDYEQITSLLRDGRRHQGVDFKAPVGTPVKATFQGVITRRNWNFRSNGNCLELTDSQSGKKALYLHLSEIPSTLRVGSQIKKGQVIASSGNSGRSFAPHLHYQLMKSEKALDPFKIHDTQRLQLDAAHQAALKAEVERMNAMWAPVAVAP